MAPRLPRIGYECLPSLHGVWGPADDSSFPAEKLADWNPGTRWRPVATSNAVANGDMLQWTAGAAAAPDGFTLAGAGASVARSTTIFSSGISPYSAAVTRAGTDCRLEASLTVADWKGKTIEFGGHVRSGIAGGDVTIRIFDGATATGSSPHSNDDGWDWFAIEAVIPHTATELKIRCILEDTDGTAYFQGLYVREKVPGGDALDESPVLPETARVYLTSGEDDGINLAKNPCFRYWSDGPTEPPDNWAKDGTADPLLSSDAPIGPYALSLTSAGAVEAVVQEISAADLEDLRGKDCFLGFLGKASAVGIAAYLQVTLRDGTTEISSCGTTEAHTGGGAYEWLESVSAYSMPHDVHSARIRLVTGTTAGAYLFSGVRLIVGSAMDVDQMPPKKTVNFVAIHGHNLGTAGLTIALEGTDSQASGFTSVMSWSPSSNVSQWKDINSTGWSGAVAKSYRFWRIRITGGPGSQRASIGVLFFGQYLELPRLPRVGWNPYDRKMGGRTSVSDLDVPSGRSVRSEPKEIKMEIPRVTEAFVVGSWATFLATCGERGRPGGSPFFLAWDQGDHDGDLDAVLFGWLKDGYKASIPFEAGMVARHVILDMLAVAE